MDRRSDSQCAISLQRWALTVAGGMVWFRWHHGSVTDPKFQLVARRAGASLADVLAVWVYVLEAASQSDERGRYGVIDCEAVDLLFSFPDGLTQTILDAMEVRSLLAQGRVSSWAKRQPKRERDSDHSTGRVKAFRERQRQATPPEQDGTPINVAKHQETPRGEERRLEEIPPLPPEGGGVGGESAKPTKAGEVCRAIKAKGVADVNPSNPVLLAYIARGVTVDVFEAAAEICANLRPPKGFVYLLGIVKRQVGDAAQVASGPVLAAGAWDASRASIEAKAKELGMEPWNEHDLSVNREMFPAYTERVRSRLAAVGVHA